MMLYICTEFRENIFNGFNELLSIHDFHSEFSKWQKTVKHKDEV